MKLLNGTGCKVGVIEVVEWYWVSHELEAWEGISDRAEILALILEIGLGFTHNIQVPNSVSKRGPLIKHENDKRGHI